LLVAAVAVSDTDYGYDKRYRYIIPLDLSLQAKVGMRAFVPFGKGDAKRAALIIKIDDACSISIEKSELETLKTVDSLIDDAPIIGGEMLDLIVWLRETTLCTYFDAFKALIPAGLSVKLNQKDKLSEPLISDKDGGGFSAAPPKASSIELTASQSSVYNGVRALIDDGKPCAALLHGVTGSGKTPVYAKLIEYTLKKNRTALLALPEISLTPQVVGQFKSIFGEAVAVFHSGLPPKERLNEYKRVKHGRAVLVIGTRSAIFAPLERIGLMIIDEEGEWTYKSEASPRYNAKDVAKKRCVTHNAVLLMASATPSVESYYYALKGRYKLFSLPDRYNQEALPEVNIIDLASKGFCSGSKIFSEALAFEINQNLERKEQTILLLNRRGYHTFISCADCKKPITCANCSVPMTYHKAVSRLHCHYCSYSAATPENCPECGGERIMLTGVGTQRVEDEISLLFPAAKILRMDADTTYSRHAYEKGFAAFKKGEYDIMLGTQMIAKGLDFPNVTLVGVLSVDNALFTGDFRSYERTFSLVTQVVGRCGRSDMRGRAFIQTFMPEHYVLNLAALQDYRGFYEQEIAMRKALIYPPFCDTCLLEFKSESVQRADAASKAFFELLRSKLNEENLKLPLRVIGPAKCIHEKINGKYRYRIIIKCKNNSVFRNFIAGLYKLTFTKAFSGVSVSVDFNGSLDN